MQKIPEDLQVQESVATEIERRIEQLPEDDEVRAAQEDVKTLKGRISFLISEANVGKNALEVKQPHFYINTENISYYTKAKY